MTTVDLSQVDVRCLNERLHALCGCEAQTEWQIIEPDGRHSIAVGMDAPARVTIEGHVGYYCGGMNQQAEIVVNGHAGPGLAENMMSGTVWVSGSASQSAGASMHGGLLIIRGDASSRCGISLKGGSILVGGSVGHMSAFMAQAGQLVVCGDAGDGLGDSIYEADLYVGGAVAGLGSDCVQKDMTDVHYQRLTHLLEQARVEADPQVFRRYGSARTLYNFHADHAGDY